MLSFSAMDAAGRVGVIFVGNVYTALINVMLFLSHSFFEIIAHLAIGRAPVNTLLYNVCVRQRETVQLIFAAYMTVVIITNQSNQAEQDSRLLKACYTHKPRPVSACV